MNPSEQNLNPQEASEVSQSPVIDSQKSKKSKRSCLVILGIFLIILISWEWWYKTNVFRMSGTKMSSTIENNECRILKRPSSYSKDQIIIYRDPKDNLVRISRIIASPGDDVRLVDDVVYVNNKKIKEGYKNLSNIEIILAQGEFVALGDNNESIAVPVKENMILGLAEKPADRWAKIIPGCAGSYINSP